MEVWLFFLSPECEPLYLFRLTQGFELNLCGHLSEVKLFKVALTDHYESFRSCGCTKTAGDHWWCSLYSWFCSQSRTQASLGYVFHCNLHLDMVLAAFHGAYMLWRWKQDHSICCSLSSFFCNNATMGVIRKLSLLTILIWPFVQLQSHWWQMEQQSRMRCHWLMISTAWQSWTPLLFYKNLSITVLAMPYHLFAWLLFTHFKLRIRWPHVDICHSH